MNTFYSLIPSFQNFNDVMSDSVYHVVPEDWFLILTDVRGSTKAIQEGRYRDVNMLGAGSITAVLNAIRPLDIPYVFGGDGATLLVPSEVKDKCLEALAQQKWNARKNLNFDLRVGVVPVSKLLKGGQKIEVAKFEVSSGNYLAMFRGGGLSLAETWVKNKGPNNESFELPESADGVSDLTGLSCRWEPLQSRQGKMLSLLIVAQKEKGSDQIYKKMIAELETILRSWQAANPVGLDNLKIQLSAERLTLEAKMKKGKRSFLVSWFKNILNALFEISFFKFNISVGGFDPKRYLQENVTNVDYKKFDDALRMVVDCREEQIQKIESLLLSAHQRGDIFYGIHVSNQALMTCLVFSASQGRHIHFIDGGDGGYAMAATQLKSQMKMQK